MGTVCIQGQFKRRVLDRFRGRSSAGPTIFIPFALALAAVLALQYFQGAYSVFLASHPDEPAHVVTSLMYREYLLAPTTDPLGFAEDYYSHYPYVGAGHWPPTLHLTAAIWTIFTGSGRVQLLLYLALAAAACAALLYHSIKSFGPFWMASAFVAAWILLESTRVAFSRFMTELPLTCLALAAVISYTRYLRTPSYRLALFFSALASAAILTKETAVALAVVPLLSVTALGRWELLREGHFWLPAGVVTVLVAPWHLWVASLGIGRFRQGVVQRLFLNTDDTALDRLWMFVVLVGWPVLLLALAGLIACLRRTDERNDAAHLWIAHAGFLLGGLIIALVTPESKELRHIYHLGPSILIFAAAGAMSIGRLLADPIHLPGVVALSFCSIFFSPVSIARQMKLSSVSPDASAIAGYISAQPDTHIVLVSGEGAEGPLIAEAALLEPTPSRYFVRASKTIYQADWSGKVQKVHFGTIPELSTFIRSSGFDLIVPHPGRRQAGRLDPELLPKALAEDPSAWGLVAVSFPGGAEIYRRIGADKAGRQPIRLGTSSKLGHDLIIQAEPAAVAR